MTDNFDNNSYEVDFMNIVVDKADSLKVIDADSHFSKFTGVHISKIKQGKLYLYDFIKPSFREEVMRILCKKESQYYYFDAEFKNKSDESVYLHCTGKNIENSTLCQLTLADISKTRKKQEEISRYAQEMDHLIDMVNGGVCLFKVTSDLHINVKYLNEAACKLFGTTKAVYKKKNHRLDELIHPDDKSLVFQSIGKAMATGSAIDIEFRTIVHKGEYRWCKFNAAIQSYDEDNSPIFHAVFTDITSLKQAEAQTDLMYEQLIKMFKNVPTPVFSTTVDEPLVLDLVSEDFIKFTGYSRSYLFEEHGGRLVDFIMEREQKYVEASIKKQLEETGAVSIQYSLRTRGGKYLVVEDNRKIIEQNDGTKSMLCSLKNVTEDYHQSGLIIE